MEFDNSFEVPLSPAQAWTVLMDIPRIAPCMPGAELTEVVDPQSFKGKISVRLGPVALAFAGRVQIDSLDENSHSARVKAQGSDAKGRGSASAAAAFHIEPTDDGSRVIIHTDLSLSGAVAQYGRGIGMIQATAAQIIGQFAANLRTQLAQQPASQLRQEPASAEWQPQATANRPVIATPQLSATSRRVPHPPAARPISGLSLIARVLWQQVVALFTGRRS